MGSLDNDLELRNTGGGGEIRVSQKRLRGQTGLTRFGWLLFHCELLQTFDSVLTEKGRWHFFFSFSYLVCVACCVLRVALPATRSTPH